MRYFLVKDGEIIKGFLEGKEALGEMLEGTVIKAEKDIEDIRYAVFQEGQIRDGYAYPTEI